MMQKTLSKNNTVIKLFGYTLRKNLGIALLVSVFVLLLSPFSFLDDIRKNIRCNVMYNFPMTTQWIIPLIAVVACGLFVVFLYINFSYLYNKSAGDMFHSVPVTRAGLIVSKFAGAYVASLIPLAVGYIGLYIGALMPNVNASFSAITVSLIYTAFMMIFCGAFALIFIIIAGTVFDSIISLLVVNIGLPVISALIYDLCRGCLFGFPGYSMGDYLVYSSPFLYSIGRLLSFEDDLYIANTPADHIITWVEVLVVLALTALFFFLCFFLYNRRKSEKVSTAYAFSFVPAVIGIIISVIGYNVFAAIFGGVSPDYYNVYCYTGLFNPASLGIRGIVFGVVGACLGSIVYNLITNRGFKKIVKALIVAGVSLALIAAANCAVIFDIFGYGSYVPKDNDIMLATVSYRSETMEIDPVSLVTSMQKEFVTAKKNGMIDDFSSYETVTIQYLLKNGKLVKREYYVPLSVGAEQKETIIQEYLPEKIKDRFAKCHSTYFNFIISFASSDQTVSAYISAREARELIYAYCADLQTAKLEDTVYVNSAENFRLASVDIEEDSKYYEDFIIPYSFTATHNYISTLNLITGRKTVQ